MNKKSAAAGQVVLVAGGTGNVGENIVRAFLRNGATVVVPSRSAEKLQKFVKLLGDAASDQLITVIGDVSLPEEADRIRREVVERAGKLDAVAAALGGWWQGQPLIEVPLSTWNGLLHSVLTCHFVAAQTFIPELLKTGGAYTFINGLSAEEPWPLAGPVSVAATGQVMLGRALARELEQSPVRVNELVLGPVMTRARHGRGDPEWVTGEEVGEFVVRLSFESRAKGQVFRLLQRRDLVAARVAV